MRPSLLCWLKLLALPLIVDMTLGSRFPNPELKEPLENPQVVTDPICPDDNGNLVKGPDGHHWTLICGQHESPGSQSLGTETAASPEDCMARCLDKDPECNSFRWLGENNNCMFFKHGDFTTATSCSVDTHDWYYIGDAPPQDFPNEQLVLCSTECPTANGQKYVSEFGKLFHMECGRRHGTINFRQDTQATFRDCIDECAAIPKCNSVDYSNRTSHCYYGTHGGAAPIDAPGYFSAYALGCAGACDRPEDGCCCGVSCDKDSTKDDL